MTAVTLICLLLSGCYSSTLEHRRASATLYVPHSTATHPVKYDYTQYSGKPVQGTEVYYGPHRPAFFTDMSPNIEEMPERVEIFVHRSGDKQIIASKRRHHMPGSKLTRPR